MTIDERLNGTIQSNANIVDKVWFNKNLQYAKHIYSFYDVDYDFSNILDIVKTIKIEDAQKDEIVHYDRKSNTLISKRNLSNEDLFYQIKSFLQITSQTGLTRIDSDGKEQWANLNDIIMDKLILNIAHISNKEDSQEDLYTISKEDEIQAEKDDVMNKMTNIVPASELIYHFVNGQGEELYNKYFVKEEENIQKM